MRRSIPCCVSSRFGAIASISSMKIIVGACARAWRKISRRISSDLPDSPVTISGADLEMKVQPSSPASACARCVLPHPGGP